MERPLVRPLMGFVGGMAAAWSLGLPGEAGVPLVLLGVLSFLFPTGPIARRPRSTGLMVACVLVGMGHYCTWNDRSGPRDVVSRIPSDPTLGSLRGIVLDVGEPMPRPGRTGGIQRTVWIRATAWRPRGGDWAGAEGRVRVTLRDARGTEVGRGMTVEVFGLFQEPGGPELPGAFDLRRHLWSQEVRRVGVLEGPEDWHCVAQPDRESLSEAFLPWAHSVLGRGVPDDAATRMVRSLVLGWRAGLDPEWREAFLASGTMHVFAISGLHIALVAGAMVQLLLMARVPREACVWLVVPLVWAYVGITGWQASAIRSGVMTTVVAAGWALRRPSDILNSLAVSAWIILVFEPGQLFQAGFQLSFGAVAGMILWAGQLSPWVEGVLLPDRLEAVGQPRALRQRFRGCLRWLAVNLATSMAAFLATLPFVVQHFQLVSFSGLLANLLVVPVSGLCLMAGLLSLAMGPFWEAGSAWMNQSAWLWMESMMEVSRWAARIPGGHVQIRPLPWLAWLGYGWLVFGIGPRWWSGIRPGWIQLAATGIGLVGCSLVVADAYRMDRLICLPWGGGILVEAGWSRTLLVDAGPAWTGRRLLPEWIRRRGADRLDGAIAAAGESRFAGGWPGVFEGLDVEGFWVGPEGRAGSALRKAHEAAHANGIPVRRLIAGREACGWEVAWPPEGLEATRSDGQALVLFGRRGGVRICLLPSLNPTAQRKLVSRLGGKRPVDIVIAGMPAQGEPLIPEMLRCLTPALVVLQVGERPSGLKPSRSLRRRLRSGLAGGTILFTDETGVVTIEARGGRWRVVRMDPCEPRPEGQAGLQQDDGG